jgi:uncharacterized membrane protein SpoIIM required for sporulation
LILFIFYLILIIYCYIYNVLARLSQKRKDEIKALFKGTGGASQISQEDFGAASSSGNKSMSYTILFVITTACLP